MEGDFTEVISGRKNQATNKYKKNFEGTTNSGGGSRFDILSNDMDDLMEEGISTGNRNAKGKDILADITNLDSPNGNSGLWIKKSSRKTSIGDKMKTKLATQQGTAGCSKVPVLCVTFIKRIQLLKLSAIKEMIVGWC
ncbi:hypothetical protein LWI29_014958 [Acer saccharum]|uniref:Uncharacterized protein n=1 Tax=Acer saccharum TaxID=4024 RepID=A0AA39VPT8_ACESA|nr:hypothetical protein LWI29_014958 [Acer saccharum]